MYFILYRYSSSENWKIRVDKFATAPTIQKFETVEDAKEAAESTFGEGCTCLIVREVAVATVSKKK